MPPVPGLLVLFLFAFALLLAILTVIVVRGARRPPRRTAAYAIARGLPCDPGDLGLAFESWTLDAPGGVSLPVWEIEGRGAAAAPTVILIHGWGQGRVSSLGEATPWLDDAARVVLYDLRGHGEAGGLSNFGHREDDDLLALIERLGDGPFLLVGHSMGAVVAVHAAARTSSVAGVIAYGVYTDFHAALRARLRLAGYPTRPLTDLAMLWLRLTGIRHRPLADAAKKASCPFLFVHGSEDVVAAPADVERLAAAAADAQVHRVDGAAHADTREVDRAGHDAAIDQFVTRIAAS